MNAEQQLTLEHLPGDGPPDETDIGLRAYLTRISDEKLAKYDPSWTDDQVMEWDGNFRDDGNLMLVCCERDIDVEEFRRVLAVHMQERQKMAAH